MGLNEEVKISLKEYDNLRVIKDNFYWLGEQVRKIAESHPNSKPVTTDYTEFRLWDKLFSIRRKKDIYEFLLRTGFKAGQTYDKFEDIPRKY